MKDTIISTLISAGVSTLLTLGGVLVYHLFYLGKKVGHFEDLLNIFINSLKRSNQTILTIAKVLIEKEILSKEVAEIHEQSSENEYKMMREILHKIEKKGNPISPKKAQFLKENLEKLILLSPEELSEKFSCKDLNFASDALRELLEEDIPEQIKDMTKKILTKTYTAKLIQTLRYIEKIQKDFQEAESERENVDLEEDKLSGVNHLEEK